jgi:hypothetical protein
LIFVALDKCGPLLLGCAAFPALSENKDLLVLDATHCPSALHLLPTHAMLVVGIRWIGPLETGTFELLILTSFETKPFLVFRYELIRALGINQLIGIKPGLAFNVEENKVDDPTAHTLLSGTGSHFEVGAHGGCIYDPVEASVPLADAEDRDPLLNTVIFVTTTSTNIE